MGKCDNIVGNALDHASCEAWFHANKSYLWNTGVTAIDKQANVNMFEATGSPEEISLSNAKRIISTYVQRAKASLIPEYSDSTKQFIIRDLSSVLKLSETHVSYVLAELKKSVMGEIKGRAMTHPCVLYPLTIKCDDKSNALNKKFNEDKEDRKGDDFFGELTDFFVTATLVVATGVGLYFIVKLMK